MESDRSTYTSEEARGGATDLQMVLANLCPVEHGVERGDFIDLHGGHLEDLGSLVHSRQSQEVVVLLLGDEKHGDHGAALVVVRVLVKELLDSCVRLVVELEWRLLQVVCGVTMVRERTKGTLLCCSELSGHAELGLASCMHSSGRAAESHKLGQHFLQWICLLMAKKIITKY